MQLIKNPEREKWTQLLQRPYQDNSAVLKSVKEILDKVRIEKDKALKEYTERFDGYAPDKLRVTEKEINEAGEQLPDTLKKAILAARKNIEVFHQSQINKTQTIETMPGIHCWRKSVAIEKVGLYIPGGTAPLFSTVLMLGIPAKMAGCRDIILCTPCDKEGKINAAILYTADVIGIRHIFKAGGAQAIAAMAYGTDEIPAVYKIFGPGNQYVTAAKQLIQMDGVSIDMPAGPSEVCVIADKSAKPAYVAADLLSQAEHGTDSQVVLISTSEEVIEECLLEIEKQLANLPRKSIAEKVLNNSKAFLVNSIEVAVAMANEYAAEHLIINCANANEIADKVSNAGSVFIGPYSPESVGDYASGTNHTLPTNGFARAYSGVSLDSFVKKITFQQLDKTGLNNIAGTVIEMAEAEGLQAHAEAVKIRIESN